MGGMYGRHVAAPISSMPYHMMVVPGGLGVDMGWLRRASWVADGVPLVFACECLFPNLLLSVCYNA